MIEGVSSSASELVFSVDQPVQPVVDSLTEGVVGVGWAWLAWLGWGMRRSVSFGLAWFARKANLLLDSSRRITRSIQPLRIIRGTQMSGEGLVKLGILQAIA